MWIEDCCHITWPTVWGLAKERLHTGTNICDHTYLFKHESGMRNYFQRNGDIDFEFLKALVFRLKKDLTETAQGFKSILCECIACSFKILTLTIVNWNYLILLWQTAVTSILVVSKTCLRLKLSPMLSLCSSAP